MLRLSIRTRFAVSSLIGTRRHNPSVNFCIVAVTYSQAACLGGGRVCNYAIHSNELRRLNPRRDIATHSPFCFPIVFLEKVTDDVQPAPFFRLRPAGSLGGPASRCNRMTPMACLPPASPTRRTSAITFFRSRIAKRMGGQSSIKRRPMS